MTYVVDPAALRTLEATLVHAASTLAAGDCSFDGNRGAATFAHLTTIAAVGALSASSQQVFDGMVQAWRELAVRVGAAAAFYEQVDEAVAAMARR